MHHLAVGVDIGGTFTDGVVVDESRATCTVKELTTPDDPGQGFMQVLDRAAAETALSADTLRTLVHATTVATNAIIEGKGARVGLVVTRGFRDVLEIARQIRPDLFDLTRRRPDPLVPRSRVLEVVERTGPAGEVITPLDETSVEQVAHRLTELGCAAVVVCLLHSYVNPAHERRVTELLDAALPSTVVVGSADVWPEYREYARASTCLVNASVQPVVRRYLDTVQAGLAERGLPDRLWVMQSSGGVMTADTARHLPVQLVESGPAAGLTGVAALGKRFGCANLISLDVGGTTAKVGLIIDGEPVVSYDYEVGTQAARGSGRAAGYPIRTPVLDLVEIGAGGGSLAWVDAGGILRVGPESAGATPGPACYGLGGDRPTLTDANLVLGRLDPTHFLGGRMKLDLEAAKQAIANHCGEPLGRDVFEVASAIVDVANANMVRALRLVTVQRGHDPADFVMVAFGGAGPQHAIALAGELGIPRVVVPTNSGVLSAVGLLAAPVKTMHSITRVCRLDNLDATELARASVEPELAARQTLEREGVDLDAVQFRHEVDLRYVGQSYELTIPTSDPADDPIATLRERFFAEHRRAYGHAASDQPVEAVNWKVTAFTEVPQTTETGLDMPNLPDSPAGAPAHRSYPRTEVGPGAVVTGPATIYDDHCTTFVEAGWAATTDDDGNLHLLITERTS